MSPRLRFDFPIGICLLRQVPLTGPWLLAATLIVIGGGFFATMAYARSLEDEFTSAYPQAQARLREAYRHVRITGQRTTFNKDGSVYGVVKLEEMRDGDQFLQTTTCEQNVNPDWPPGSEDVSGGNATKYFELAKKSGASTYRFTSFGPRDHVENALSHAMPSVVSPFRTADGPPVIDYLSDPASKVVSAESAELDGHDLVEVTIEQQRGGTAMMRELYFVRNNWALAGWSEHLGGMIAQGRVDYEPNTDPPKILSLHEWIDNPKRPGLKTNERKWGFTQVQFGPIPAARFTLASFGMSEPGQHQIIHPDRRYRWRYLAVAGALLLFGIGLWLGVRVRRRAPPGAGPPVAGAP